MLKFVLGERKNIKMNVTSRKQQIVVITEARYTISDRQGSVVATGECEINQNSMSVLYCPEKTGMYVFEVNYTIPPETLIARCDLCVD